mmetsp:Transcript_116214/g.369849  ORF Transcript_116214/g.369849 Transcript_116214/m.369849 type:complete len:128 (+) Transcript_116214:390-773(+)
MGIQETPLFPRISAYVGQEDLMPAHWKVREAIEFNAVLKSQQLAAGGSRKELVRSVDSLLQAFGLSGVADSYVGGPRVRGISGGERRARDRCPGSCGKALDFVLRLADFRSVRHGCGALHCSVADAC